MGKHSNGEGGPTRVPRLRPLSLCTRPRFSLRKFGFGSEMEGAPVSPPFNRVKPGI